jgi:hypothetical protein
MKSSFLPVKIVLVRPFFPSSTPIFLVLLWRLELTDRKKIYLTVFIPNNQSLGVFIGKKIFIGTDPAFKHRNSSMLDRQLWKNLF